MLGRHVPDAKAAVWRTRDAGKTWQDLRDGLPQSNVFFNVLRQAMAADPLTPAGLYFGTNTGDLYAISDEGEGWTCLAEYLPTITSVETFVPKQEAGAASGTVLTVLISVGGVALAIAVSIYKSYTASGSPNEAATINAILIGAGIVSLIAALMIALFGREPKAPAVQTT